MNSLLIEIVYNNKSYWFDEDIISLQYSENSKDSDLSPAPGVIEQNASARLYDRDDYFIRKICNELEEVLNGCQLNVYSKGPSSLLCGDDAAIVSNYTIVGAGGQENLNRTNSYIISSVEIEKDNSILIIQCSDITNKLSRLTFNNLAVENRSIHDWLTILFDQFLEASTWYYSSSEIEYQCKHIVIPDSYVDNMNGRELLDTICNCASLNVYQVNGIFYVSSSIAGIDNVSEEDVKMLTPYSYNKGMKSYLDRKNQIDTIKYELYVQSVQEETLTTQNITSVKRDGSNVNLPITNKVKDGTYRFKEEETNVMEGKTLTCIYNNGPYRCSKGYAGVMMASKTFTVNISDPVSSISAQISYNGGSMIASDIAGEKIKWPSSGQWHFSDLIYAVDDAEHVSSTWSNSSSYVDYVDPAGINVNPYVSKVIQAGGELTPVDGSYIITKWTGTTSTIASDYKWTSSKRNYWTAGEWDDVAGEWTIGGYAAVMNPSIFYNSKNNKMSKQDQQIKGLRDANIKPTANFIKISDYSYEVTINVPVFYAYAAHTEFNYGATIIEVGWSKLDSLAFYDFVNSIDVTVKGYKYLSHTSEISYSLDSSGNLTNITTDNGIFEVGASQLLKVNTKYYFDPDHPSISYYWYEWYAKKLLNEYKVAKYTAIADVLNDWIESNNIKVNSAVSIINPDRTLLTKKNGNARKYNIIGRTGSISRGRRCLITDLPTHGTVTITTPVAAHPDWYYTMNSDYELRCWGGERYSAYLSDDSNPKLFGIVSKVQSINMISTITLHKDYLQIVVKGDSYNNYYTAADVSRQDFYRQTFSSAVLWPNLQSSRNNPFWHGGLEFFYGENDEFSIEVEPDEGYTAEQVLNEVMPNGTNITSVIYDDVMKKVIFQVKNIDKKFESNIHLSQLSMVENQTNWITKKLMVGRINQIEILKDYVFKHDVRTPNNIAYVATELNGIEAVFIRCSNISNNLWKDEPYYKINVCKIELRKTERQLWLYRKTEDGLSEYVYYKLDLDIKYATSYHERIYNQTYDVGVVGTALAHCAMYIKATEPITDSSNINDILNSFEGYLKEEK